MSRKILLVEDNVDNQAVCRTILEHYGFTVLSAWAGDEAIEMARSERPDLILMDIAIPVIDGWEATRILKSEAETKDIPILALTAHALPRDREKSLEAGCDGYLTKPIVPTTIVEEVRRALHGAAVRGV